VHAFFELDQRRAHFDVVAAFRQQAKNAPGMRRGDLDHGLFGLDRHQGLIGDDMVAGSDMPVDELGFLQAFAEIGESEARHR